MPPEKEMPAAAAELYEAHEERIQRLESGVQALSTGLATNTAKLEGLGDKFDLSVELIGHKIDSCVAPLAMRLSQHITDDAAVKEDVEAALTKIERDRKKIDRLEESAAQEEKEEVAKEKKSKRYWRVAFPFLIAASGWFGRHLWGLLFPHK